MNQLRAAIKYKIINSIKVSRGNFEIIQPLILTSRIFGLCPVCYKKKGASYVLEWSLLYSVYSYLLSIVVTTLAIRGLVEDIILGEKSARMKDRKSIIITTSDISIVIFIAVFCLAAAPCRMKLLWKLLSCLNKIDSVIPLTNTKEHRRKSVVFISIVLILFFVVEIFDVIIWDNFSRKKSESSYLLHYTGFYLLYYVIVMQEVYFWHLIYFLKIRIAALNEYLVLEEDQREKLRNVAAINSYIDTFNIQQWQNLGKKTRILFKMKTFLGATTNINDVERIITLTKLHNIVSSAIHSINNSATNGILLIIASCLDHLIVTPYFLLQEIMKKDGDLSFICLQTTWFLAHICRLLIIVEPCQLCLNERQRTLNLVCSLLTNHNIEEDIRKALTMLTMQLSQNKIKFSCSGLFKIDRSLITSVAGAVTTYLVILFQLRN